MTKQQKTERRLGLAEKTLSEIKKAVDGTYQSDFEWRYQRAIGAMTAILNRYFEKLAEESL